MAEKEQVLRSDRMLTIEEHLNYYLNMFQDKLVANCVDIAHYTHIEKEDPNYKAQQPNGQLVGIKDLLAASKKGARFARNNVEYIKEMLKKYKDGKIEEVWSDDTLLDELEKLEASKVAENK